MTTVVIMSKFIFVAVILTICFCIISRVQELQGQDRKVQKLQIELVGAKGVTDLAKDGWGFVLRRNGLVDIKGHAIDNKELRSILRLTKINDGRRECILFIRIEDDHQAKQINVFSLTALVKLIETERDPNLPTFVYFILPRETASVPQKDQHPC